MKVICFLLAALTAIDAQAGDACDNVVTTLDINKCAQADHQKSDKRLNVAYKDALKRIESRLENLQQRKDTKQGLVDAQRLWVQFRDKDCGAVYDLWRDGTIRGAMYWGCMTAHTESRTKDLELFANEQ